jgi:hypothetical protein
MGIKGEEIQTEGTENILHKIKMENFPNLGKEMVTRVQEASKTANSQS